MKIKKCRSCSSSSLKNAFDLGSQKLTGVFPKTLNENIPSGSLAMVFCEKCKLLQLENSFNASMMYGDNYGYMSSLNPHMINHLINHFVIREIHKFLFTMLCTKQKNRYCF